MSDPQGIERISVTVAEAAAMTGLSRPAVYRAVCKGELESRRVGGRILVLLNPLKKKFGL